MLQSTVNFKSRNTSARFSSSSPSLPQGSQNKNLPSNESYSKLNEDNESFPMPNFATNHVPNHGQRSVHRVDKDYVAGDELAYPGEVYRPKYIV